MFDGTVVVNFVEKTSDSYILYDNENGSKVFFLRFIHLITLAFTHVFVYVVLGQNYTYAEISRYGVVEPHTKTITQSFV